MTSVRSCATNRGWHNGITAAGGDEYLRDLIAISRWGDGQETRNNSDNCEGDAGQLALKRFNDNHLLTGTVDYYHKTNHTHYSA